MPSEPIDINAVESEPFWSANQPGFRFTDAASGTPEFFADVERHRYSLERHIPELVRFEAWRDHDVLEVGCGIATDGINFARAGARYTGLDQSAVALDLGQRRFALEGQSGRFLRGRADALPFADESFDLVYSHGVVHHMPVPQAAVSEFHRVLRPGGTALVMVYHRHSLNYYLSIMTIRRVLVALLMIPGAINVASKLTGESTLVLQGHRRLLQEYRLRYLFDHKLFLSNNTDGPGNPLSRVYSRAEGVRLLSSFTSVLADVRYLNCRIYPGGAVLARSTLGRYLEPRLGWHLYLRALKGRA